VDRVGLIWPMYTGRYVAKPIPSSTHNDRLIGLLDVTADSQDALDLAGWRMHEFRHYPNDKD